MGIKLGTVNIERENVIAMRRNNNGEGQSVESNIADLANGWLRSYKLDYKLEQESLNTEIDQALNDYFSKKGGAGGNRSDAKLLL